MADVHELLDTWIANVKDEELLAELNTMKEQGDEDAITDALDNGASFRYTGSPEATPICLRPVWASSSV